MSKNGLTDWASIGDQKQRQKLSNDVVFLNAKNLPQTFLPSKEVLEYQMVYDEGLNRFRPPEDDDEDIQTQYIFYGLFIGDNGEKEVKFCCCKPMVAKGISSVQKTLRNHGMMSFVEVTSTGKGLNTTYNVEGVKVLNKPIPEDIWDKPQLKSKMEELGPLEDKRDSLLGLNSKSNDESPADDGDDDVLDDIDI